MGLRHFISLNVTPDFVRLGSFLLFIYCVKKMLGGLYYSSFTLSSEPFALLPQIKKRHLYFRINCVCVDVIISRQRVHAFYVNACNCKWRAFHVLLYHLCSVIVCVCMLARMCARLLSKRRVSVIYKRLFCRFALWWCLVPRLRYGVCEQGEIVAHEGEPCRSLPNR